MIFKMGEDNIQNIPNLKKHYNKIFIFRKNLDFGKLDGYSSIFGEILCLIDKFNKNKYIMSILQKLFTIGTNLRNFDVGDFSNYNKFQYTETIKEGYNNIYHKPNIKTFMDEFNMVEIDKYIANHYIKHVEIEELSILKNDRRVWKLFIPDRILKKYNNKIIVIVEKITKNFEQDLLLELMKIQDYVDSDCGKQVYLKDYMISESICSLNCHRSIAVVLRDILMISKNVAISKEIQNDKLSEENKKFLIKKMKYIELYIQKSINNVK